MLFWISATQTLGLFSCLTDLPSTSAAPDIVSLLPYRSLLDVCSVPLHFVIIALLPQWHPIPVSIFCPTIANFPFTYHLSSPTLLLIAPTLFSTYRHRWASTSISMSAISDIRHRHLIFQYRRQICRTEKRHSDIGSVPISTSELIPISDIEEKNISTSIFEPTSLETVSEHYNTKLVCLSKCIEMLDIGYRIKVYSDLRYNVGLRSLSPISEVLRSGSVRYRWSRISD
jgi:hypothetical protein